MAISKLDGFIERLMASWAAYHDGLPLTQAQLASAIANAWSRPRGYRITQRPNPDQARETWALARAAYLWTEAHEARTGLAQRRARYLLRDLALDVTTGGPDTATV